MEEEIEQLKKKLGEVEIRLMAQDTKLEAYKNAMQQVVNLAFGLIASATIAILISRVK